MAELEVILQEDLLHRSATPTEEQYIVRSLRLEEDEAEAIMGLNNEAVTGNRLLRAVAWDTYLSAFAGWTPVHVTRTINNQADLKAST
eukprot:2436813-Heterocapsa_arctica.AAC.1